MAQLVRCPDCNEALAEVVDEYRGRGVRIRCRRCKKKTLLVAAEDW